MKPASEEGLLSDPNVWHLLSFISFAIRFDDLKLVTPHLQYEMSAWRRHRRKHKRTKRTEERTKEDIWSDEAVRLLGHPTPALYLLWDSLVELFAVVCCSTLPMLSSSSSFCSSYSCSFLSSLSSSNVRICSSFLFSVSKPASPSSLSSLTETSYSKRFPRWFLPPTLSFLLSQPLSYFFHYY
jgi:hypothetical protein